MKILLVEDEQSTRELLATVLSSHHYIVDAIADGTAALALATQWHYDLILLDILLPHLNGIEVCRRLRAQACPTPILMLTVKDSNEDVIIGLDAGADDYVAKSCDSSQLLARVRALLRRRGHILSSPILSWELLRLDPSSAQVSYGEKPLLLRPKEYHLLELFLRHPQRIFSRSAIIDQLWSIDDPPVEGSITNLIKDLRQRLRAAGMEIDLIETVYGLGYRLKTAPVDPKQTSLELPGEQTPAIRRAFNTQVDEDRSIGEQRGVAVIEKVTERFQVSLGKRIAVLEAAERSLNTSHFPTKKQENLRKEVHKLAGGLGTFGYVKASKIAQDIEDLFDEDQDQHTLAHHFSQLLKRLKQELNSSPTNSFNLLNYEEGA